MITNVLAPFTIISGSASVPLVSTEETTLDNISIDMALDQFGRRQVTRFEVDGAPARYTDRFAHSLSGLIGQSSSIFRLFTPDEVMERVLTRRVVRTPVKVSFAHRTDGTRDVLAVVSQKAPVLDASRLIEANPDFAGAKFEAGCLRSTHAPVVSRDFTIAGDDFKFLTTAMTPLDGFGSPAAYLSTLRLVCSNGMVAMAPIFRSEIATSLRDPQRRLVEFLRHGSTEGEKQLKDRLTVATTTRASLAEAGKLVELLRKAGHAQEADHAWGLTGVAADYGISSLSALSPKRAALVPTRLSVYDLMQTCTEFSTHRASEGGVRQASALAGSMLAAPEFDLEEAIRLDAPTTGRAFYFHGSN